MCQPDAFRDHFDSDPERAREQFDILRAKLRKFFAWRCQRDPEEMTSETIARALRQVAGGRTVPDFESFCYGIAINVVREGWKKRREDEFTGEEPAPESRILGLSSGERTILLEQCLRNLPAADRELLRQYYCDEHDVVARMRDLSPNALRIRVFRILERVRREVAAKNCEAAR